MNKQQTIVINGAHYDAHTGMRLDEVAKADKNTDHAAVSRHQSTSAHALHSSRTKHSQTLSRRHVQLPAHKAPSLRQKPRVVHYAKSPMVTKFTQQVPVTKSAPSNVIADIGPTPHPRTSHHSKTTAARTHSPQSASHHVHHDNQSVKNHAIHSALEKAVTNKSDFKAPKKSKRNFGAIAVASLALMLLAGYLTYINMPSLSVKVASAQAGIAASYPSYQPSGYGLTGPVAFNDGQVTMKFAANTGTQNFTLNQSRSTWDSSALLDNYVQQASNGQYETFQDSGLTIYTYGSNAAWVNGGILHTINGDATLSSEQIRHIATSM